MLSVINGIIHSRWRRCYARIWKNYRVGFLVWAILLLGCSVWFQGVARVLYGEILWSCFVVVWVVILCCYAIPKVLGVVLRVLLCCPKYTSAIRAAWRQFFETTRTVHAQQRMRKKVSRNASPNNTLQGLNSAIHAHPRMSMLWKLWGSSCSIPYCRKRSIPGLLGCYYVVARVLCVVLRVLLVSFSSCYGVNMQSLNWCSDHFLFFFAWDF